MVPMVISVNADFVLSICSSVDVLNFALSLLSSSFLLLVSSDISGLNVLPSSIVYSSMLPFRHATFSSRSLKVMVIFVNIMEGHK